MKITRIFAILLLGLLGFFAVLVYLNGDWQRKHDKIAHELCDSIPIGTPAQGAKERAREMARVVSEIEVKDLSIRAVFLNPYSPGDRIVCEANIWNDKIVNNTVSIEN